MFKEGDWALIVYKEKKFLKRLNPKGSINVKKEVLKFSEVIGKEEGIKLGNFEVFKPTIEEIILLGFERQTQIIYPKDSFYIAFKLGINKEKRVLEFGTGSGSLCAVLSILAKEVYTFEKEERFYKTAKKNFEKFGLGENVKFHLQDFREAEIEEEFFDCAFIDVKDPTPYIDKVHKALKPSGAVGFLLPTANQVIDVLKAIEGKFGDIEIVENLQRFYKTLPERFRPEDTMVGHTAYLLFAKKLKS